MTNLYKIAKKVLMSQSFFEDGYEYQFVKVELDEDGFAFNITVNVILPKKGQSYATAVFSGGIHKILDNIWGYIGSSFSYSEHILVDGKEPINNGVYISPEKQNQLLFQLRKQIKRAEIITNNKNVLSFDVQWIRDDKEFYKYNDVYVNLYFFIDLSNFKFDGKRVIPNLKIGDEIAGIISDNLYDDDSFKSRVDNIIYSVMNDEMDLRNIDDMYLEGLWHVRKLDGMEVFPTMRGYDITDNMFT
jgi:effector-binding domain-containing protein